VERRVDVRGGGVPLPTVERPVREVRDLRRKAPRRNVARDALLLLGLLVVGVVTVGVMLPDGPLTAAPTEIPSGSAAAIGSVVPPTLGPVGTPNLVTLTPIATASGAPTDAAPTGAAPTPIPVPTPTLRPGQTPRPTVVPPKTPTPTAGPTAVNSSTLIVKVQVSNGDGGTATPAQWTVSVDSAGSESPASFPGSSSGTTVTISANATYDVVADLGPSGYASQRSSACSSTTAGLPVAGGSRTCTILKNDRKPVVTIVTNVDGGTATPSDWTVSVTGTDVSPSAPFAGTSLGKVVQVDANAPFSVDQNNAAGGDYDESRSGTCSSSGLDLGASVTCTFTFTYVEPPPTDDPPTPAALLVWLIPVRASARRGGPSWTTILRR
jgi:hypothetical protein